MLGVRCPPSFVDPSLVYVELCQFVVMIQNWITSDDTMTIKSYDGSKYDKKKAGYPRMKNTMSALDVEDMGFVRMKI